MEGAGRAGVEALIELLGLQPHPEGGHYREVYRAATEVAHPLLEGAPRAASTHVYFLLAGEDFSAFHRVRGSDEIWHWYEGDPVELHRIDGEGRYDRRLLGPARADDAEPVVVVPAGWWQAARVTGDAPDRHALCGCTVAPGFDFADFEMPGAEELVREVPEHEEIVRELTR